MVTVDTTARKVKIFTRQDEGESSVSSDDNDINLVSEYEDKDVDNPNVDYIFTISQNTIDRLYQGIQSDENVMLNLYTTELMSKPFTPTTIKQALTSTDRELWRKSAIAEVNNFLKRKS